MRILQVITDTDRRGAQVFATDLGTALENRGHEVTTVALAPGANAERLPVDALGARTHGRATRARLRAAMAAHDVTVAHGSSTLPACALAGLGPGRPFVYRQISDSRFWAPTRARRLRVRALMGRAARVVALARASRDDLVQWIRLPEDRIRIVPNGVPGDGFPELDPATRPAARALLDLPERPTALFIAALVPEKGADRAIRALARLDGWQLAVAGDGPERAALERLADEVAPGRVRFLGSVAEPVTAYAVADLVVFPSLGGDSMPAALIEAGLCGLPVIATPVGAIAEVVADGATGVLVPVDDEDALVTAWRDLGDHPNRREALGAAARHRCVEEFEISAVAARWERVLAEVVPDIT